MTRKIIFLLLLITAMSAFSWSAALAAEEKLSPEAEAFVQKFLTMVDNGEFKQTYPMMAPVLALSEHEYVRMLSERTMMGEASGRTLLSVETVTYYADLPDGKYLKLTYETAFDLDAKSKEYVILDNVDGGYGIAGYQIRFNRWPEAIRMIGNGLLIVFFIMTLLATTTWGVGRIVQSYEKKKAAAEKK